VTYKTQYQDPLITEEIDMRYVHHLRPVLGQHDLVTVANQQLQISRMVSSGMLHRVALVRTDVSEELSASFIRMTRIGELGTTLAAKKCLHSVRRSLVTASVVSNSPILVTLMKEALSSSET
jgi:hypothetical protein